jgi:cell division protein FtsW (lipid II flippase)
VLDAVAALPRELRAGEARWWVFFVVLLVLLLVLVIGDPGRIDRQSRWLRLTTGTLIGIITVVNASAAVRLVASIIPATAGAAPRRSAR